MSVESSRRPPSRESMCSRVTAERSSDPIGHALETRRGALLELPKPWAASGFKSVKMPPAVSKLIEQHASMQHEAYAKGGMELIHQRGLDLSFAYIAPDREYSVPGHTRLMVFTKPEPPFACYHRQEWLLPNAVLPGLIEALTKRVDTVDSFDEFQVPGPDTRDIIVCTQGNVDTCCATFGYPVYRQMRKLAGESDGRVRVWEATHFQYHRYAPVALELPAAIHWGQLTVEDLQTLILRDGPLSSLRNRYMGWSGAGTNAFAQAAEREAMVREGWDWLSYIRHVEIVSTSHDGESAVVRVSFRSEDRKVTGAYEANVAVSGSVTLPIGCFYPDHDSEVKQYEVTKIERTP